MALTFKKVKEKEEELWAGQPHLSPGAPMEHGPWHPFPHMQRTRNQGGLVNVSRGDAAWAAWWLSLAGGRGLWGRAGLGAHVAGLSGDLSTISHHAPQQELRRQGLGWAGWTDCWVPCRRAGLRGGPVVTGADAEAGGVSHLCRILDEETKCTLGKSVGDTKLGEWVA